MNLEQIKQAVAQEYAIGIADINGSNRCRSFARPRQIVMHLACKHTGMSLTQIGREIGNRDHATIIFGRKRIAEMRRKDFKMDEKIRKIEQKLTAGESHDQPTKPATAGILR